MIINSCAKTVNLPTSYSLASIDNNLQLKSYNTNI